jgi:hypothetical protein
MSTKKEVMEFFGGLPRDVKKKIQEFYQSRLPFIQCVECQGFFYQNMMSDINTCGGMHNPDPVNNEERYMCNKCVAWYDQEEGVGNW